MVLKERVQELEKEINEPFNFWQDKTPCWEMCHCPEDIKSQCPAYKNAHLPCWEIEGTYLKLSDDGTRGDDLSICQTCRVYKKYGAGKPIEIKLRGKGLDTYCRSLQEKCQEIERGAYTGRKKAKGVIGRIRNLVGRAVTIEEDWMLKSRDWPYMWKKK
jgi:hypothetical protein